MIYDSIQTGLFLVVVVWWLVRRKRWVPVEKLVLGGLVVCYWAMAVAENVMDDLAIQAAVSAAFGAVYTYWLLDSIGDEIYRRAAAERWNRCMYMQDVWERQQDWRDGEVR